MRFQDAFFTSQGERKRQRTPNSRFQKDYVALPGLRTSTKSTWEPRGSPKGKWRQAWGERPRRGVHWSECQVIVEGVVVCASVCECERKGARLLETNYGWTMFWRVAEQSASWVVVCLAFPICQGNQTTKQTYICHIFFEINDKNESFSFVKYKKRNKMFSKCPTYSSFWGIYPLFLFWILMHFLLVRSFLVVLSLLPSLHVLIVWFCFLAESQ